MRMQKQKNWAKQEKEIMVIKLDQWEITKSMMLHNTKKLVTKLTVQIEEANKMIDCDFETNKNDLIGDIDKLGNFIKTDCGKQIRILQDQIRNGVSPKENKEKKEGENNG